MLKRLLVGIVEFSARARWLVVAIAVAAAAYSGIYVTRQFADRHEHQRSDFSEPSVASQSSRLSKVVSGRANHDLAVIDAPTAELAQSAADRLTKRLKERHEWFRSVTEGSSLFFRRNGLLYLPEQELTTTLNRLSRSGPLLGRLAADPSLRGVMDSIRVDAARGDLSKGLFGGSRARVPALV